MNDESEVGILTDKIMSEVKRTHPDMTTHTYNGIWSAVNRALHKEAKEKAAGLKGLRAAVEQVNRL